MLMRLCIAAAVALGCTLMVPGTSFAAGDKDKSATASTNKAKAPATKNHKKPKKGFAGKENPVRQQNLWVSCGSGNSPSL